MLLLQGNCMWRNYTINRRQHHQLVKVQDLKSGDPLWPLVGIVWGSPLFNSLVTLEHSQLVSLLPVGIHNLFNKFISVVCFIGPEKPQQGEVMQLSLLHIVTDYIIGCLCILTGLISNNSFSTQMTSLSSSVRKRMDSKYSKINPSLPPVFIKKLL